MNILNSIPSSTVNSDFDLMRLLKVTQKVFKESVCTPTTKVINRCSNLNGRERRTKIGMTEQHVHTQN